MYSVTYVLKEICEERGESSEGMKIQQRQRRGVEYVSGTCEGKGKSYKGMKRQ